MKLTTEIAGVVALALAIGGGFWLWLRARAPIGRRRKKPRAKLEYPVVLAHGLLGFDEIAIGKVRREYFRGVKARLEAMGADVHVVKVSALASVEQRARELAEAVKSIDAKRVNLIAHSMGGLDARYAIAKLGIAPKVASLITVGTPHRGTPLADIGTSVGETLGLRRVLEGLGIDIAAFYDLTTKRMRAFNRTVPNHKNVWYGCMLARAAGGLNPLLVPVHKFLQIKAGANDGLVPRDSQRWGEVFAEVEADHWAQIGWTDGFDAPALYARAIEELKARGL